MKLKTVIIEDELLAAKHLEKLLQASTKVEVEIVTHLNSVKNAIKWMLKHEHPDVVFMDVDLSDGLCFEIFEVVEVSCPVIFTTAYDEYAIQAFKVNSIDYLLKPLDQDDLDHAISKLLQQKHEPSVLQDIGKTLGPGFKERFIIKIGEHLKSVAVSSIHYFFSRDKATYAMVIDDRYYLLDYTMDQLEALLDPSSFFRINRKYFVHIDAITDIISYSNSRLRLVLKQCDDGEVIVSREKVKSFKKWLDR